MAGVELFTAAAALALETETRFPELLRGFRVRAGRSRNNLAHEVGVDTSYLTRIEHGDREPPRSHIVDALARSLRLPTFDHNRLLVAAGYSPRKIPQGWNGALQAIVDVQNSNLTLEEKEQFAAVVQIIASKYLQPVTANPDLIRQDLLDNDQRVS